MVVQPLLLGEGACGGIYRVVVRRKVHGLAGAIILLEKVYILEVVGVIQLHIDSFDVATETNMSEVCGLLAGLARRRVLSKIIGYEKVLENVEHNDHQITCNICRARINKHQLEIMIKLFGKLGLYFLFCPSSNLVEDHASDL